MNIKNQYNASVSVDVERMGIRLTIGEGTILLQSEQAKQLIDALTPLVSALTVETAKTLPIGATVYHVTKRNADGSAMRAKVTSVKTWKRSPNKVLIGLKHGLYDYAKFDESDIHLFSRIEPIYPKK